jgi:DNA replication and repair protein RecF
VIVTRLAVQDFRSYASAQVEPGAGFVVLTGENGAGKTNILEAVSLLTPGRGLRRAPLSEMARSDGPGGFAVSVQLGDVSIGTGAMATAPERRIVRVNGMQASVNSLGEWLSVLWLTPAMDRLFTGTAGDRRRFLDRLVLALEPAQAHHATRYEAAMRARNKLLSEPDSYDADWLGALEAGMAEHGAVLSEARRRTVVDLDEALSGSPEDAFARAAIRLQGWVDGDLTTELRQNRGRDAAAGRATAGPHRQDLAVTHRAKDMPAAHCSTGEQKALLLGLVLAHAELVSKSRETPLILLLDEVAAHLDPRRRNALFSRLEGHNQVWMTGTELSLFAGIGSASNVLVADGVVQRA